MLRRTKMGVIVHRNKAGDAFLPPLENRHRDLILRCILPYLKMYLPLTTFGVAQRGPDFLPDFVA